MKKTLVVWRRFGKEHGETSGFKVNPPSVVETHIQQKVEHFTQTPAERWRWWQLSNGLVIEKYPADTNFDTSATIYYLPPKRWAMMQNPGNFFGEDLGWYIHIGETVYEPTYGCWIFTDLFCDVLVKKDNQIHSVLDLDDLAEAFEIGLITETKLLQILRDTQALVNLIWKGNFPPAEVEACQKIWIEAIGSGMRPLGLTRS